jgi:chitin disaccharide deacetylase
MSPIAICVDDYGLHHGVNDAAIALARAGRVSAISAMVGGPAWAEGAPALKALAPGTVDVGLHLDLTEHSLPGGERRPLWHWIAGAALRPGVRRAVRREIEGQLDAFVAAMGRLPAYVDGHRHVHQMPGVRDELLAALAGRGGTARIWLRNAQPAAAVPWCGGKPWLLAALGAGGLKRRAKRAGRPQNAHLLGVYDFRADPRRYLALAARWLDAARACDVWMCHPATTAAADDPIAAARLVEYQVLAGPELGALLHDAQVQVVPLSQLALR